MKKKLFLVFLLALIIILFLLKLKQPPLQIVSVSPVNQAQNIELNPLISIQFNREPKNIFLKTQPKIDYSLIIEKNNARLTLNQNLKPATKYSLIVFSGKKKIFSWSFTTRKLTEDEAIKEEMETTQKLFPLAPFLPYETEDFQISYEEPLVLNVVLKKKNKEKIEKEVLDWIASKGIDPQNHQIKWITPEL